MEHGKLRAKGGKDEKLVQGVRVREERWSAVEEGTSQVLI